MDIVVNDSYSYLLVITSFSYRSRYFVIPVVGTCVIVSVVDTDSV